MSLGNTNSRVFGGGSKIKNGILKQYFSQSDEIDANTFIELADLELSDTAIDIPIFYHAEINTFYRKGFRKFKDNKFLFFCNYRTKVDSTYTYYAYYSIFEINEDKTVTEIHRENLSTTSTKIVGDLTYLGNDKLLLTHIIDGEGINVTILQLNSDYSYTAGTTVLVHGENDTIDNIYSMPFGDNMFILSFDYKITGSSSQYAAICRVYAYEDITITSSKTSYVASIFSGRVSNGGTEEGEFRLTQISDNTVMFISYNDYSNTAYYKVIYRDGDSVTVSDYFYLEDSSISYSGNGDICRLTDTTGVIFGSSYKSGNYAQGGEDEYTYAIPFTLSNGVCTLGTKFIISKEYTDSTYYEYYDRYMSTISISTTDCALLLNDTIIIFRVTESEISIITSYKLTSRIYEYNRIVKLDSDSFILKNSGYNDRKGTTNGTANTFESTTPAVIYDALYGIKKSTIRIDGMTKTKVTPTVAGDVWVLGE